MWQYLWFLCKLFSFPYIHSFIRVFIIYFPFHAFSIKYKISIQEHLFNIFHSTYYGTINICWRRDNGVTHIIRRFLCNNSCNSNIFNSEKWIFLNTQLTFLNFYLIIIFYKYLRANLTYFETLLFFVSLFRS